MIKVTNNFVYVYKFKIPQKYNKKYFEDNFPESKVDKNMYKPKDSDYSGSLIFVEQGNYGEFFFKFSKIKDKGIMITDLKRKIQRLFGGMKNYQKYTTNSFFAYYPDKNILLGLYNDEAMKHIIAPLTRYFIEFIGEEEIESDMIKLPINIDKILNNTKYINNIIIKTAIGNIDNNAQVKKLNPFSALEDYSKGGELVQYFQYLKGQPIKSIIKILKEFISKTKAHSIIINADNINLDILGKLTLRFPCKVKKDSEGFPLFNDFKSKIESIYNAHKDGLLKGY